MANPRKPPPDIPPAVFRGGSWLLSAFGSRGYALVGIWERAFAIPIGSSRDWHERSRVIDSLPINWMFATAQVVSWDMNYTASNSENYEDHHLAHIGVGVGLTVEEDRAVRLHLWDLLRDKNGDDSRRGQVRVRLLVYSRLSETPPRPPGAAVANAAAYEADEVIDDTRDVERTLVSHVEAERPDKTK